MATSAVSVQLPAIDEVLVNASSWTIASAADLAAAAALPLTTRVTIRVRSGSTTLDMVGDPRLQVSWPAALTAVRDGNAYVVSSAVPGQYVVGLSFVGSATVGSATVTVAGLASGTLMLTLAPLPLAGAPHSQISSLHAVANNVFQSAVVTAQLQLTDNSMVVWMPTVAQLSAPGATLTASADGTLLMPLSAASPVSLSASLAGQTLALTVPVSASPLAVVGASDVTLPATVWASPAAPLAVSFNAHFADGTMAAVVGGSAWFAALAQLRTGDSAVLTASADGRLTAQTDAGSLVTVDLLDAATGTTTLFSAQVAVRRTVALGAAGVGAAAGLAIPAHVAGATFDVPSYVNAGDRKIDAVEFLVQYDAANLMAVAVTPSDIWLPGVSGNFQYQLFDSHIHFGGLSFGGQGARALVATVTFTAPLGASSSQLLTSLLTLTDTMGASFAASVPPRVTPVTIDASVAAASPLVWHAPPLCAVAAPAPCMFTLGDVFVAQAIVASGGLPAAYLDIANDNVMTMSDVTLVQARVFQYTPPTTTTSTTTPTTTTTTTTVTSTSTTTMAPTTTTTATTTMMTTAAETTTTTMVATTADATTTTQTTTVTTAAPTTPVAPTMADTTTTTASTTTSTTAAPTTTTTTTAAMSSANVAPTTPETTTAETTTPATSAAAPTNPPTMASTTTAGASTTTTVTMAPTATTTTTTTATTTMAGASTSTAAALTTTMGMPPTAAMTSTTVAPSTAGALPTTAEATTTMTTATTTTAGVLPTTAGALPTTAGALPTTEATTTMNTATTTTAGGLPSTAEATTTTTAAAAPSSAMTTAASTTTTPMTTATTTTAGAPPTTAGALPTTAEATTTTTTTPAMTTTAAATTAGAPPTTAGALPTIEPTTTTTTTGVPATTTTMTLAPTSTAAAATTTMATATTTTTTTTMAAPPTSTMTTTTTTTAAPTTTTSTTSTTTPSATTATTMMGMTSQPSGAPGPTATMDATENMTTEVVTPEAVTNSTNSSDVTNSSDMSTTPVTTTTTATTGAACGSGQWLNGSDCRPLRLCNSQQFEVTAPTATSDRACQNATRCRARQYETTALTATSNRVCHFCPPVLQRTFTAAAGLDLATPVGLALDVLGNVIVADTARMRVVKLDRTGALVWATPQTLQYPLGVAAAGSTRAYFTDNHRLGLLNATVTSTLHGSMTSGSGSSGLSRPYDVVVRSGRLVVSDNNNNRLVTTLTDGTYVSATASATEPRGLGVAGTSLYVAQYGVDRIVKLDANMAQLASWSASRPYDVAAEDTGVVVATLNALGCLQFSYDGELAELICNSSALPLDHPRSVVIDSARDLLYITDNNAVLQASLTCPVATTTTAAPTTTTANPLQIYCNSTSGHFVDFQLALDSTLLTDDAQLAALRDQVLSTLTSAGVNVTSDVCDLQFSPGSIVVRTYVRDETAAEQVFGAVLGGNVVVTVDTQPVVGQVLGIGTEPITPGDSFTTNAP